MTLSTLTDTLLIFIGVFRLGFNQLLPSTTWLFGTLLSIEIALTGLYWAIGSARLLDVIKKTIFIGFWIWIVFSFPMLVNSLVESLAKAGAIAGSGGPGAAVAVNLLDPSGIVDQGFVAAEPILIQKETFSPINVADRLLYWFFWLLVLLLYFVMAIQVFLTVLEFYLVTALVGILLPFGLLSHTKFLAEKSIGAVISAGIKMMVLSFILTVAGGVIASATLPIDPNHNQILALLLTIGAIALLVWNAPGVAAGLIAGSPSLTAGTALQNAVAGGFLAAGAASGALNATKGAAKLTGSAARLGASGAGAASTGANLALAANSSTNTANRAGSAALGAIYGVGAAASNTASSTASSIAGRATSALSHSSMNGGRAVVGLATKGNPSATGKTQSQTPSWARRTMHRTTAAAHAVPQEARPSGGNINPNIKT